MCKCNVARTDCVDEAQLCGHACLSGWYPDPLLDIPKTGIPRIPLGFTQPIFLEACVPCGQPAGKYSGQIKVSAATGSLFTVPVVLEVWDIDLPRLNESGSFNTAFTFSGLDSIDKNGPGLRRYYPSKSDKEIWEAWMPFLAKHRIPGDDVYLDSPRPVDEYVQLAPSGAKWMNMLRCGKPSTHVADCTHELSPIVETLAARGLISKAYVYGFDEMKSDFNLSVHEVFGGIKSKWPAVRTVATLNWQEFPDDLPLNVWVDHVADYESSPDYKTPTAKEQLWHSWLASGATSKTGPHSFWRCWSIQPNNPRELNTFVERPAIAGRLLFWLAALHAIPGMLYYEVDRWSSEPYPSDVCKSIGRIKSSAFTDFSPRRFAAQTAMAASRTRKSDTFSHCCDRCFRVTVD